MDAVSQHPDATCNTENAAEDTGSTVSPLLSGPARSESVLRPITWIAAAALAVILFGASFVGVLCPPRHTYSDFVQEWLSAWNYRTGEPIYLSQREALRLRTGQDIPAFDELLPRNAHPPATVLVALPFGWISDYRTAHLVWNLLTLPLLLLSIVLVIRELKIQSRWWSVFTTIALVLPCSAVLSQLYQGQLNFLLLFLLVAAWSADRRGKQVAAGIAVGAATALKVFPGLLLVYFLATRRWRAAVTTIVAALVINGAALMVFGPRAFADYVGEVLPGLSIYRGAWLNIALTGYWTRVGQSTGLPALCAAVAVIGQIAVVAAVWWVSRRAATTDDRDRAFALVLIGMPLVSPVAWTHYFVLLLMPMLLLWERLPRGAASLALVVACAVFWFPEEFYPGLLIGREAVEGSPCLRILPGGVPMAVFGLAPFTAALLALFGLAAGARFVPRESSP